ncbi:phosphotransferase family protein [Nocardia sp. alder85J]|uniref:phosphotransferase family protein n=1 Tax=Nocardia sp. alder85J TaxID=2862949 RepID=UPI001CD22D99|nr:phosphotransferase family protein [Nocardia sp. alder85J]MCX4095819.1 phosphotransferase family protein [Nocardia sp. alder85J]
MTAVHESTEELSRQAFLAELTTTLDDAVAAGGSLRLTAVDRRGEGNSWETYLVDAAWESPTGPATAAYAVKRQPRSGIVGDYDVTREVVLLRTAAGLGLPVPAVIAYRAQPPRGFFVMEKVSGAIPLPATVSALIPDRGRRDRLGRRIARTMAQLHTADPATMDTAVLGAVPAGAATGAQENDKWTAVYRDVVDVPIPVLDLALAWLGHRSDAVSGRVALVHNDFRVGNLVVDDTGLTAILDWETAHFSDPVADIAWFAQRTSRGRSPLLCKLIELEPFLDEYESVSGWRPAPDALGWWAVQSLVKTAIGCLQAVHIYTRGDRDDLRYANMAHSVYYSLGWLGRMLHDGEWGH